MKTYTFVTDGCTAEIESETADLAAVEFATDEEIKGVKDLETFIVRIDKIGGWARVYEGDDQIAMSDNCPS